MPSCGCAPQGPLCPNQCGGGGGSMYRGMRKQKPRLNFSERLFSSGFLSVITLAITLVSLLVLLIDDRSVIVQVIYSILTVAIVGFVAWMVVTAVIVMFGSNKSNDRIVGIWNIVDLFLAYLIMWTSIGMLLWVWDSAPDRDSVFTNMTDRNPFLAWVTFDYIFSMIVAGVGYGQYVPQRLFSEVLVSQNVKLNMIFFFMLVAAGVSIALENISVQTKDQIAACFPMFGAANGNGGYRGSRARKSKSRKTFSERIFASGFLALGALVMTVISLLVLLIDSRLLAIQLVYTGITVLTFGVMVWMVVTGVIVLFDRVKANDRIFGIWNVIDVFLMYVIATTSAMMLFWVWDSAPNRDTVFTNVTDQNPFLAWLTFDYISTLVAGGVGYGQYIPVKLLAEAIFSLFAKANLIFFFMFVGAGITIALENINKAAKSVSSSIESSPALAPATRRTKKSSETSEYAQINTKNLDMGVDIHFA